MRYYLFISKELTCPAVYQNSFNLIKEKLLKGASVNSHLSKRLLRLDYNDSLLNDWGIYHLHLGESLENNNSSFIERTGPLLFIRIDGYNAYLIDILHHGSWACQKLIKVIHDNWPKSIEKYLLKRVTGLSVALTDKDIIKMRKAGISSAIKIAPNIVYFPLGGGYSISGYSIVASREVDCYYNFIYNLKRQIQENLEQISQVIIRENNISNNKIILKLIVLNQIFFLEEQNTKVLFNLNVYFPNLLV